MSTECRSEPTRPGATPPPSWSHRWGPRGQRGQGCPGSRSKQGVSPLRTQGWTPGQPCAVSARQPHPACLTPPTAPGIPVWFKNRRAHRSRLERQQAQGGYQRAGHVPTDPGAPQTPAPALESTATAASPSFPDSPGLYSRLPPPSPAGVLPAPEPGVSSHHLAMWVPAQGVHVYSPAAPTPAPAPALGWPQDPYVSNYRPDPLLLPACGLMFSSQELSSPTSGYQTGDSFADENDTGPRQFTNL
ncbi:tetra-peptide repeat homeobox protein 1-like [Oryx dammah]|uniref:tetra-peptide repeat homeobox protein 1-like n=1 Tax=Oryx dammah TaxID=59534 RepID=UPI001A9A9D76|nr:tetra-peptide repeat homeobox protein 1-like [Oryx dammah]